MTGREAARGPAGPAGTAPSTPQAGGPHGMRMPATPFVGRIEELASLAELLADPVRRLVTLVGPPGVGKTRLALEAARRAAGAFPGGTVAVSLAPLQEDAALVPTLLAASGGADMGSADPMSQLVDALSGGRRLLVADNAEHLPQSGPLLAELTARCPGLTVLATSRQPLSLSGERVMALAPFDTPEPAGLDEEQLRRLDGVALLRERLSAVGASPGVSVAALRQLAEICRLVDGLPLAIELAAARGRVQSIAGIQEDLEHRLPGLERAFRDAEPRHRTMRTAIAWSVALLSEGAALAFRRAGVLSGWTWASLAAVVPELDARALADALTELVEHSLVIAPSEGARGRYRMLHVIREFALEQLSAGERTVAGGRHAEHFAALATATAAGFGDDRIGEALDQLEGERDNLRAALAWAVGSGATAVAESLCLAQRMLWYVRGPLHEGSSAFASVLALPTDDPVRRSRVLSEAAALERQRGDLAYATELSAQATRLARGAADPTLLAGALLQEGFIGHLSGDYERSGRLLEESARLAEGRDDLALARALHHLGIVRHFGSGDDAEAAALQHRALDIYRRRGALRQVATVQVGIAELERCRGAVGAARGAMREALGIFDRLGDLPVLSYALEEAASIEATVGMFDRALRLLGAADGVAVISGAPAWPVLARVAEEWLPDARAALGPSRAAQLRASGAMLTPAEAIRLASADPEALPAERRLSRREREIASLVSAGLTNREIAARLYLSERTVDGHVARILDKLDFRTRTQIATWMSLGGDAG